MNKNGFGLGTALTVSFAIGYATIDQTAVSSPASTLEVSRLELRSTFDERASVSFADLALRTEARSVRVVFPSPYRR
jgi:hypothetical protein